MIPGTSYHHGTYIIVGDAEDCTSSITSASTYNSHDSTNAFWVYNRECPTIEDLKEELDKFLLYIERRQDSINGILNSCFHDKKLHSQIDRKPFKRIRRKEIFHFGRSAPGIRKD